MTERIIIAVLALTAFSLADGPVQPEVEPWAFPGWSTEEGTTIRFVWVDPDTGDHLSIVIPPERIAGTPQSMFWWVHQRESTPTVQQMFGVSDDDLLLKLRETMDPNHMIDLLGIGGCAGDTNGDGVVDLRDLNLVMANFGKECN